MIPHRRSQGLFIEITSIGCVTSVRRNGRFCPPRKGAFSPGIYHLLYVFGRICSGTFSCDGKTITYPMSGGIQLEVQVTAAPECPLVALPGEAAGRVVSKSQTAERGTVREILEIDSSVDKGSLPGEMRPLFSKDSSDVLLYERPACIGCPCECVEEYGSPVSEAFADNGCLTMRLYLQETEAVRKIVSKLETRFEGVRVNHLIRDSNGHETATQDIGYVDRGRLTERQREALDTAHRMGYFDYPRQANASQVAERLEINRSTLVEHLSRAQGKLLRDLFDS